MGLRAPATSLPVTKGAERAQRVERGSGGGLRNRAGGRRALERRGRETLGSLEQRKRPTMWEGRRPPGPGPGRPKSVSAHQRPSGAQPSPRTGTAPRIEVQRLNAGAGSPGAAAVIKPRQASAASCLTLEWRQQKRAGPPAGLLAFDGGTTQHGSDDNGVAHGSAADVDNFFVQSGSAGGGRLPEPALYAPSGVPPSQLNNADAELHFAGGDPQSAGFCDGPGPGMALEQNPFLPPTTTGRGIRKTVLRSSDGAT